MIFFASMVFYNCGLRRSLRARREEARSHREYLYSSMNPIPTLDAHQKPAILVVASSQTTIDVQVAPLS